jgi:hypothetical protein
MKRKWIFGILTVLMICLIFSLSQGTDKFYYGSWWGDPERDFSFMKDSLRFNIVQTDVHSSTIDSFVNHSLRAMVGNPGWGSNDEYSPYCQGHHSHYTLWEAEGLEGSYYKLGYNGGTLVDDASASGGKAMQFTGPAEPRLIQYGPTYYQERGDPANPIQYTAEFRLQYTLYIPRGAMAPRPPGAPVCSIMVVDRGTILKAKKIYTSDLGAGYKKITLEDYTVPESNRIEFQIYWFGTGVLYVDYVKVYDQYGSDLIDDPNHRVANNIKAYVDSPWVHTTLSDGDTVVYRWYLQDQPGYIDQLQPARYIDSLLRVVSPERVGFQAICLNEDTIFMHEYFLRNDPEEYQVDGYPTFYWGRDSSGVRFQDGVSEYTKWLNICKNQAEEHDKDLWVTIQGHFWGEQVADSLSCWCGPAFPYGGKWYCGQLIRPPTGNEVRLQTFLALCYGADAILHFNYPSRIDSTTNPNQWKLELGLYDNMADTPFTERWLEIAHFTGPRMEKLGPVFNQLTWLGACPSDSVGSFILRDNPPGPSYIHNIVPQNHFPPYVQIGFFRDSLSGDDYFLLVNRRCLPGEEDSFTVFLQEDTMGTCHSVIDMYDSSGYFGIPECGCGYNHNFPVYLRPGEGRLFKLWESGSYWPPHVIHVPSAKYPTIQAGIDSATGYEIVLVEPGTYYENIDFKGKIALVTSKFHTTGDTSYISRTIIDGSHWTHQDSASVVRFVSGENFCSCIKGFTLRNGSGTKLDYGEKTAKNGGGIACRNSSPTITNNIIISDSVPGIGGGIFCSDNSSPKIINNVIKENTAGSGGGICGGGSQTIIANNLIIQNTAEGQGGGIDLASGIIANNIIDRNSAPQGGGIWACPPCQMINNIVTNSQSGEGIYCSGYGMTISYNDVWYNNGGNFSCSGYGDLTKTNRNGTPCDSFYNIIQNPNFVVDGYHFAGPSPCIDAGNNNAPTLPPTDFDGNPRVADGDTNGSFFVDMGAYEYQTGGYGGFAKIVGGDQRDTETISSSGVPDKFSLLQNYPNPFNPATVVKFEIVQPAKVSLKIYNILGRLVRVLVDEEKSAGTYTTYWDGNDQNGQPVSSGIYFYKLDAGNFSEVKKMVLIK